MISDRAKHFEDILYRRRRRKKNKGGCRQTN
jgi:hypothetical protein